MGLLLYLFSSVACLAATIALAVSIPAVFFSSSFRAKVRTQPLASSVLFGVAVSVVVGYALFVFIFPWIHNQNFREWTGRIGVGMTTNDIVKLMGKEPRDASESRWYFRSFEWGGKAHPQQYDFYCDLESGKVVRTAFFHPDD